RSPRSPPPVNSSRPIPYSTRPSRPLFKPLHPPTDARQLPRRTHGNSHGPAQSSRPGLRARDGTGRAHSLSGAIGALGARRRGLQLLAACGKSPGSSVHPCVPCDSRFSLVINQSFPSPQPSRFRRFTICYSVFRSQLPSLPSANLRVRSHLWLLPRFLSTKLPAPIPFLTLICEVPHCFFANARL